MANETMLEILTGGIPLEIGLDYLCGNMVFLEDYSHENAVCWKILNPFTRYASDKLVLCKMDEGIEKALILAIEHIGNRKTEFFGKAN